MSHRRLDALGLAILAPLGGILAVLAFAVAWAVWGPAESVPAPVPARAAAPAAGPRLRGYLSPAPPRAPAKLVVYVAGPDGREVGYLFRGEFRPSAGNPAVIMFAGPAELLATTDPIPDPGPPSSSNPAAELLAATNRARAAAGLPALVDDPRLDRAAQAWAAECSRRGVLTHMAGGSDPWKRIAAEGVKYTSASENGAAGQRDAAEVVSGWLSDPPHKANVLGRAWTHVGSGMARDRAGRAYWFQDYAQE